MAMFLIQGSVKIFHSFEQIHLVMKEKVEKSIVRISWKWAMGNMKSQLLPFQKSFSKFSGSQPVLTKF